MHFVSFHVHKKHPSTDKHIVQELALLSQSIKHHYPGSTLILLTDRLSNFSGLDPSIQIIRFDLDEKTLMFSRLIAQIEFLKSVSDNEAVLFLDSDMLLQNSLDSFSLPSDYEVALTYRRVTELPFTRPELAINGGFILTAPGKKLRAISFLQHLLEQYETHFKDKKHWWGDQYALMKMVLLTQIPPQGLALVSATDETCVLLLPCDTFNFSPRSSFACVLKKWPSKFIIHFKGKRKPFMALYWAIHTKHQYWLWPLILVFLGVEWVHSLLPAHDYGKKISKMTRTPLRSISTQHQKKSHAHKIRQTLSPMIQHRRVLILGSGPSACDLQTEPPKDCLILATNASPKRLLDLGWHRPADIHFIVKSKSSKTILLDGATVQKMDVIENLLRSHPSPVVITNRLDYIKTLQKISPASNYFWDDGRSNALPDHLIGPKSLKSIQGQSTVAATSSGLRLLQYCLAFGASEIFLAGIDGGQNGYFWGPNTNPWQHKDIDENFLSLIGKRYNNVFSVSKNSPITTWIPYRTY